MRAHFNRPLLDRAGNQVDTAQVRLLLPQSDVPLSNLIYAEASGGATRTNPWEITNGEVDFFLSGPARVRIGVSVNGASEEYWDDVDVLAVDTESLHTGEGAGSVCVGIEATATAEGATALGGSAQASASLATAVGYNAQAALEGALALGAQATAPQAGAVAVGEAALADGNQALALGDAARSEWDHAAALGAGAATTRPNQVMVGTADDIVEVPGVMVLRSPDGTSFCVRVTDEGVLYTVPMEPYEAPEQPEDGEGDDGQV